MLMLSECKNRRRWPLKNSGFLLFEVLLTVTILSVGLVLVLRAFATSLDAMQTSQEYMNATLLLEEILAGAALKGQIERGETEKAFSADLGDFGYKIHSEELEGTDLNKVSFVVFWKSGKRPQRIDASSYIKNKE